MGSGDTHWWHGESARGVSMVALIGLALFFPAIASAAAPSNFQELVKYLVFLMNSAIGTLILVGIVIYFWGTVSALWKTKEGSSGEKSKLIVLGLVVLFVMVSIWGILKILRNTIFATGGPYGTGADGSSETQVVCQSFDDPNCFIE